MRLLFVEDNEDVRELTEEVLRDEGFDLVACASASEAEALFEGGGFDVLLTDISMPEMSGTELARRLLGKRPDLWIVFLSGYPLRSQLESWGPRVRSLLKPFESDELHALMGEIAASLASGSDSIPPTRVP